MRRLRLTRGKGAAAALMLAVALSLGIVLGVQAASATTGFHGIAFTKGCLTPVKVGDPYECGYQIFNVVDTVHDTLTISSIVDTVHSSGGNVVSGNLLDLTGGTLTLNGGASCNGSVCTLPFGSSIFTPFLSHYTVQPNDYNLPNHVLADDATLTWADLCDGSGPPTNCPNGPQTSSTGSQATVEQLTSSTATDIHNAAHQAVTVVEVGTTVHDFVTVTGEPSKPVPTGNVNIDWFLNGTCDGSPAANSGSIGPLNGSGQFDATGFAFTPASAGHFAFKAHYEGDGTYAPSVGGCEPLTVVDANIQITPATATNPVNTNHTLTCHINVNDGNGFTNAPDGTICTVTIISGPGTPVSQNCTIGNPTPGSGSCDVTITSSTTGTSVIQASTNVTVGGLVLHRETGDAHAGDGPNAEKLWADDTVSTTVRDANGNDVTGQQVPPGTVVHDEATVAKASGTPASVPDPTGTVDFTLYDNDSCNGNVLATDPGKPLNGSGVATSANFTVPAAGGSFSYRAHYNGDANYPAHDGPCEPFSSQPTGHGFITPNNTSCQRFVLGNPPTIPEIIYKKVNGLIGSSMYPVSFMYWSKITTTTPNQVVTVTQSNTSTNGTPPFGNNANWGRLYTLNCSTYIQGTWGGPNNSVVTFVVPTPGTYALGAGYLSNSIAGAPVPVPPAITYTFVSSLGPTTAATVLLRPQ